MGSSATAWYAEPPTRGFEQRFEIRSSLYSGRSEYQTIDVLDTVPFGRMLTLDGIAQTTEADEHAYHEMLVHVPLVSHPAPGSVLIIGGGDGGTLRRVLQHPVDRVVMVELDELVVRVSREYLPSISAGAFDDPRAQLVIGDGAAFLRDSSARFDVILVDSPDPIGAAEVLFSESFFQCARAALHPAGLYAMQSGSPLLQSAELKRTADRLRQVFGGANTYLSAVPVYPGIVWSFTLAARDAPFQPPSRDVLSSRLKQLNLTTGYYTPDVHLGAFALPAYIENLLGGTEGDFAHPLPGVPIG